MAQHIVFGIAAALVIGVLALMFIGAGHGWNSGFQSVLPSFVGAPLAAIAWASSRRSAALICSSLALVLGLTTDFFLCYNTLREGTEYIGRVWEAFPFLMIVWFLLFAGWQITAVAAMIYQRATLKIDLEG